MKNKPFYISTPICTSDVDRQSVRIVLDRLVDEYYSSSMWQPGHKYTRDDLKKASAMIIILPDLSWEMTNLTRGVVSEIEYCLDNGKQMALAYRKKSLDIISFYSFRFLNHPTGYSIRGITGSSAIIEEKLKKIYKEHEDSSCKTSLPIKEELTQAFSETLESVFGEEVKQESWFW